MKKLMIACLFLAAVSSQGQGNTILDRLGTAGTGSSLFMNKVLDKSAENITGTPYLNDVFMLSEISGAANSFLTRYNAYKDEVEVSYEKETFVIPKDDRFEMIYNITSNYKLKLVKYTSDTNQSVYGYLIELFGNDKVGVYRRERTLLRPSRESNNSYAPRIAAYYDKVSPDYFLQLDENKIIPFPKNKKALLNLYPSKKDALSDYLKVNKTSFKNEADLVSLTKFLATL